MKVYIGADHAGFELKQKLIYFLKGLGHEVIDHGAKEFNKTDDYPDFIMPVARDVAADSEARGIVIGSSGQGEGIAANRVKGARAFVYYGQVDPLPENSKAGQAHNLVQVSREDNNSNIISLGASFVAEDDAKQVVKQWLETPYTGEERHQRRIEMLDQ